LAFGAASDPVIAVAWATGTIALGASVALALQVLVMRARLLRQERRHEAVLEAWRPVMFEAALGGDARLPALAARDADTFLLLWNQLQDGLRGEPRTHLNRLADAVGAHELAERRLGRKGALGRVLALRALGHIGRAADYAKVASYLEDERSYLSLAAVRALVRIDPRRAPVDILPRLARRVDWPVPLVATVLAEADVEVLSARFRELQRGLPPDQLVRLLPLVAILDEATAQEILGGVLASAADSDSLCAALKLVRSPALLEHVRRCSAHEAWTVRTQAATALGRIGGLPERYLLVRLLGDAQWWVRYRAAQALLGGRFGPSVDVVELAGRLGDRFALEIVDHVLAERRP
jgi:hypothetical protein